MFLCVCVYVSPRIVTHESPGVRPLPKAVELSLGSACVPSHGTSALSFVTAATQMSKLSQSWLSSGTIEPESPVISKPGVSLTKWGASSGLNNAAEIGQGAKPGAAARRGRDSREH